MSYLINIFKYYQYLNVGVKFRWIGMSVIQSNETRYKPKINKNEGKYQFLKYYR